MTPYRWFRSRLYATVFGALIALTITTVGVSKLELGEFNFIAAMTIAVIKGTLVVWFFMDVRRASFHDQAVRRRRPLLDGDSARFPPERLFEPRLAT